MKPYFAKYLPTKQEIKEEDIKHGDKVYSPNKLYGQSLGEKGEIITFDSRIIYDDSYTNGKPKWYRVQLFLCSRDIKIGDQATEVLVGGKVETFTIHTENDIYSDMIADGRQFKTIGPISPEATWVKEGMEFDEEEVMRHHICYDSEGNMGCCLHCSRSRGCDSTDYDYRIKGPCGHYH